MQLTLLVLACASATAFLQAPLRLSHRCSPALVSLRVPSARRALPTAASPCRVARSGLLQAKMRASSLSDVEEAALRLDVYQLLTPCGMDESEIDSLLGAGEIKTANLGEVLKESDAITASAYEDKVILILDGSARVMISGELQREMGPGDFAGVNDFLQLEVTEKLDALSVDPVEELFRMADTDSSGRLSAAEVQQMLTKIGVRDISIQQAQLLVDAVDLNKDGEISLEEAREVTEALQSRKLVRELFLQADADGSGAVDNEELAKALNAFLGGEGPHLDITPEQAAQVLQLVSGGKQLLTLSTALSVVQELNGNASKFRRAFAKFDKDGSGTIDRRELAALLDELGVQLTGDALEALVASLDFNNDSMIDLPEIEAAMRRLSDTVQGRFGNVLRLYEVCVCVCVCARARVRVCVRGCCTRESE